MLPNTVQMLLVKKYVEEFKTHAALCSITMSTV